MGPESATRTCTASVAASLVHVDVYAEQMIFTSQLCPKGDGPDVCLITPVCDESNTQCLLSQGHSCAQVSWQHVPNQFARAAVNTAMAALAADFITFPIAGTCPVPRWTVLSKSCCAWHT